MDSDPLASYRRRVVVARGLCWALLLWSILLATDSPMQFFGLSRLRDQAFGAYNDFAAGHAEAIRLYRETRPADCVGRDVINLGHLGPAASKPRCTIGDTEIPGLAAYLRDRVPALNPENQSVLGVVVPRWFHTIVLWPAGTALLLALLITLRSLRTIRAEASGPGDAPVDWRAGLAPLRLGKPGAPRIAWLAILPLLLFLVPTVALSIGLTAGSWDIRLRDVIDGIGTLTPENPIELVEAQMPESFSSWAALLALLNAGFVIAIAWALVIEIRMKPLGRPRRGEETPPLPPPQPGTIAIVLVHGIGDINSGDVLEATHRAIRRRFAEARRTEFRLALPPQADTARGEASHLRADRIEWKNRSVDLVEFEWASMAGKIRWRRPVDAVLKLLRVVYEFPLMAIGPDSSRNLRGFIRGAGIGQVLVLVVTALISAKLLVDAAVTGDPGAMFSSERLVGAPLAVVFFMFAATVVGMVFLLLYRLFSGLSPWLVASRTVAVGCMLTLVSAFAIMATVMTFGSTAEGLIAASSTRSGAELDKVARFASAVLAAGFLVAMLWLLLSMVAAAANLLRDVVHYLAVQPDGRPGQATLRIRSCLSTLFDSLAQAGYARIVIVSHSLGTVIVTDLLADRASHPSAAACRYSLVTAGSPLRRLVHRFLATRGPAMPDLYERLTKGERIRVERWVNAYRVFDYVGQALTRSALWPRMSFGSRGSHRPEIEERLLAPWLRPPWGHVNYWEDDRFLALIVQGFFAAEPARATRTETSSEEHLPAL